jgi:phage host-nuclease inhibitor protein Gam
MSQELATNERRLATTADGFLYDTETGEVLSYEGPSPSGTPVTDSFQINSVEAADWALQLRSGIEGEIAGIEAQLEAVTKMLQARKSAAMRKLSWWEFRFASSLITFARSCLTGKSRTAQFSWGRVSFRRTGGNNEIIDMKAAVEWMRWANSDLIRTVETVRVSDVLATHRRIFQETGEPEPLRFIVSSEPSENVTISTGIEIDREERTRR